MHTHSPSCLEGPISGTRDWWHTLEGNNEPGTPADAKEPLFRAALVEQVRREIAAGGRGRLKRRNAGGAGGGMDPITLPPARL